MYQRIYLSIGVVFWVAVVGACAWISERESESTERLRDSLVAYATTTRKEFSAQD